ncbi:early nodulin-20-like isoform X2 [Miscanthus floridulus]|uniref:early nodulin-20-like isoform X2 n=1 Tax=Miscanthus floridulus TaxID=154761 RepID=UPI003458596B
MGSSSSASPPPPPMIGRAGNLTVFITPPSPASTPRGASRTPPPESQRSDFSTPTPQRAAPSPSPSPSPRNHESPVAAPAGVLTPPPPPAPAKVAPPPVQVPPPQYEKASVGGKHDGSAFGFFWDAVARVQEAHASLDEYVATWFGLDQSKYQWALNDYYEATGKEVDCVKGGKPKELTTTKVQKV